MSDPCPPSIIDDPVSAAVNPARLWDIFCRVIDNHGDLGVLWRLSCQLAQRGQTVRLWVDESAALSWMAPDGHAGVSIHAWETSCHASSLANMPLSDVWIEGFGCEIDPTFIAHYVCNESAGCAFSSVSVTWINLEYLSAEPYVARCHGLPSPIMSGPAKGRTKHFFYPGFSPGTGGLLREPDLPARQLVFNRGQWLQEHRIDWRGERLISLFCYEPHGLTGLLQTLAAASQLARLLVTHGRAAAAVTAACRQLGWPATGCGNVHIHRLEPLTQVDFDHLLWACDVNFVRGEDSLVRALWARKPFVWQIYPQSDGAHHTKLAAFLDWADAPPDMRRWHAWWNSEATNEPRTVGLPCMPVDLPSAWTRHAGWFNDLAERLLSQTDLVTQLMAMPAASGRRGEHD